MILAHYTPQNITVEIINVLTGSDNRKRVLVRAMTGEPFTTQTHGGPMNTNSALVSVDLLSNIRKQAEPRKSVLASGTRPEPTYGPMEEYAALFPSRFVRNRQPSTARGGINND